MSINPDIQRHMRAVLDAHADAFRALRAASEAMDVAVEDMGTAIQALGEANKAMGAANKAHDDVINAALAANRAAIDLLEYLSKNGQ